MAESRQHETAPGANEAGRERGQRPAAEAQQRGTPEAQMRAAQEAQLRAAQEAQQRAASAAARQGGEAVAEATGRTGQAAATLQRGAADAGAETMRRSGAAAARVTRHATEELAQDSQRTTQQIAEELEQSAQRTGEVLRQMAQDLSRLMQMPRSAGGGMQEMQQAMGRLVNGMVHTNLRLTQELFRRASPGPVVELQGAFMREYIHTLMDGGATVLRAARRTADEALRPLEQQLERQSEGERGGGQRSGQSRAPRVAEVMSRDVRVVSPEETVQQAARLMGEEEQGAIAVGENDRLVGMLTDRDLAIRVLAEGKDPSRTKVREVMTPETHYVFEDQDIHAAAENMRGRQVRRLPVLNRDKRLVGIVSLGDVAQRAPDGPVAAQALAGIAREGDRNGQSTELRR